MAAAALRAVPGPAAMAPRARPLPVVTPHARRAVAAVAAAGGGGGQGGGGGGFGGGDRPAPTPATKKRRSSKKPGGGGRRPSADPELDEDDLDALAAARLEDEAEEAAAAAAAAAAAGDGGEDGGGGDGGGAATTAAAGAPPSPGVLYAALQPVPPPEPFVGPVRAARVEGGKAGMGVVATRTLAAGELALVCVPLAALRRMPGPPRGAGDDNGGGGGGRNDDDNDAAGSDDEAEEGRAEGPDGELTYEPDDADLDALAGQLLEAATGGAGAGAGAGSSGGGGNGNGDENGDEAAAAEARRRRRRQQRRALAWLAYLESDDGSGAAAEPSLRALAGVFDDDDDDDEDDQRSDGRPDPPSSSPPLAAAAAALERACADATDLAFRVELEDPAASTLRRAVDEAAGAPVGPDELRRAAAGAAMDADAAADAQDEAAAAAAAAALADAAALAAPPGVPAAAVGLWPAFSLLNHSCAPTASVVAVDASSSSSSSIGDEVGGIGGNNGAATAAAAAATTTLHVRAARPVAKGAELTASHLPVSLLLSPLSARRAALAREHGIAACACPRCRDEGGQDPKLRELVADLHAAATSAVAPSLSRALAAGDAQALRRCRDQCAAYAEVADAAFARLALRPRSQLWAQASLFRLYEALALAVAACGERDPRLLELLAALAGLAAPGSREHVFWARQFLADAQDHGEDGDARGHADGVCLRAHEARYGRALARPLYGALLLAAGSAEEMVVAGAGGAVGEDDDDGDEEEEEEEV